MVSKPLIKLWGASGIGVIIQFPSGVLYSNQVGSYACLQPEVEGVYVPLVSEVLDQEKILRDHFMGPKWSGCCSNEIDNEDADVIDEILKQSFFTSFIKVDRSQLRSSCEAWVYVNIATQPEECLIDWRSAEGVGTTASGKTLHDSDYDLPVISYPFYGFGQCSGILTWSNSD
jgi:hypothetical protein